MAASTPTTCTSADSSNAPGALLFFRDYAFGDQVSSVALFNSLPQLAAALVCARSVSSLNTARCVHRHRSDSSRQPRCAPSSMPLPLQSSPLPPFLSTTDSLHDDNSLVHTSGDRPPGDRCRWKIHSTFGMTGRSRISSRCARDRNALRSECSFRSECSPHSAAQHAEEHRTLQSGRTRHGRRPAAIAAAPYSGEISSGLGAVLIGTRFGTLS